MGVRLCRRRKRYLNCNGGGMTKREEKEKNKGEFGEFIRDECEVNNPTTLIHPTTTTTTTTTIRTTRNLFDDEHTHLHPVHASQSFTRPGDLIRSLS